METPPVKVVLDTNVLISLLVFEDPRFRALMAFWVDQRLQVLSDDAVREEFLRVLHYPVFRARRAPEQVLAFYDARVLRRPLLVAPSLPQCRDSDDQKFISLAANGAATVLVTDDKQLLRMRRKLPFEIETPLKFQRRFVNSAERD